MAQQLEGVLSQVQRDSLEIVDFIFHIIQPDADEENRVVFLDEVQLQEKQRAFFLARLREIAEGTQYLFKPDAVHLKEKCQEVINAPGRFIELSRQITRDFSERHEGQMSPGVFVIATVSYLAAAHNPQKLIFLVKMDKRPSFSYSYREENGRRIAVVTEIENALNETKTAIQKCALIDVSDVFAWDVLAFDRVRKPLLSDYYKAFLGVVERMEDSALTRQAHGVVKKWARNLPAETVPPGEDAHSYAGRSLNYLKDHDLFDTNDYLNAVVRDENAERKAEMLELLREELARAGVAGQQFRPRPESLGSKDKKQVYQTAEGVTIIYEGDRAAAGLRIEDAGEGRSRIVIETNRLAIKD